MDGFHKESIERPIEIPLLSARLYRSGKEQCAGLWEHLLYNYSFCVRRAIQPEIWTRKKVEDRGSWRRWRKEARKERPEWGRVTSGAEEKCERG